MFSKNLSGLSRLKALFVKAPVEKTIIPEDLLYPGYSEKLKPFKEIMLAQKKEDRLESFKDLVNAFAAIAKTTTTSYIYPQVIDKLLLKLYCEYIQGALNKHINWGDHAQAISYIADTLQPFAFFAHYFNPQARCLDTTLVTDI